MLAHQNAWTWEVLKDLHSRDVVSRPRKVDHVREGVQTPESRQQLLESCRSLHRESGKVPRSKHSCVEDRLVGFMTRHPERDFDATEVTFASHSVHSVEDVERSKTLRLFPAGGNCCHT